MDFTRSYHKSAPETTCYTHQELSDESFNAIDMTFRNSKIYKTKSTKLQNFHQKLSRYRKKYQKTTQDF